MRLIWRLLRKHISVFELAVFFIANLIGMVVILAGIQIYSDIKPMLSGDKSLIGNEYVVISKEIDSTGFYSNNTIGEEEIEEVRNQEFIENVGEFSSAQYKIYGSASLMGQSFSTLMFFESIPDEFLDIENEEWKFEIPTDTMIESGNVVIPIVIPRNYLNLYNFGFSKTSSALPQITESFMKDMLLNIDISGNGMSDTYIGQVVGFTDRLNTILVPDKFIAWSNNYYAPEHQQEVSRLILEVENPSDPQFIEFLGEHGYVAESEPSDSGTALFFLQLCVAIIIGIGAIFSLLSIIILTLSIYLLLQKNINKLENLMLVGYSPSQVAMPYNLITVVMNISIMVISLVITAFVQQLYMELIADYAPSVAESNMSASIIGGVIITTINILFNIFIINRKVKQIARKRK